jgi:hypothetical protein
MEKIEVLRLCHQENFEMKKFGNKSFFMFEMKIFILYHQKEIKN